MRSHDFPYLANVQYDRWSQFVEQNGQIDISAQEMDPLVFQSWQRCRMRFNYLSKPFSKVLSGKLFEKLEHKNGEALLIGIPLLEDLYQCLENDPSVLMLTDSSGCILGSVGNSHMQKQVGDVGFCKGSICHEGQMGTNALTLSLRMAMPAQVVGAEHYFTFLHHFATAAAPFFEPGGKIAGAVVMIKEVDKSGPQDLALVMATARSVGDQLHAQRLFEQANRRSRKLTVILNSAAEGIMAWDGKCRITQFNRAAGEILDIDSSAAMGKDYREVIHWPDITGQQIENHELVTDQEISLKVGGKVVKCIVSLRPIRFGVDPFEGTVVNLRPLGQVHKLVRQQVRSRSMYSLSDFSAVSQRMHILLRKATLASGSVAPVLLLGELGVGKTHMAQAIHNEGEYRDAPFVTVNCRMIPPEQLREELVGVAPANDQPGRSGRFEQARKGTLFLNEIEFLPLDIQDMLLQVLDRKSFYRVGSGVLMDMEFRLIAATSTKLQKAIIDGKFSRQLYYRLSIQKLHIPPLRERVEDIPLIAEKLLSRNTSQERMVWLEKSAIDELCHYPWPGNVRELENCLKHASLATRDGVIRIPDLPDKIREGKVLTPETPDPQPVVTLREAEREAIIKAAINCKGNISKMAKILGVGRSTLWRKMQQYELSAEEFKTCL